MQYKLLVELTVAVWSEVKTVSSCLNVSSYLKLGWYVGVGKVNVNGTESERIRNLPWPYMRLWFVLERCFYLGR